MTIWDVINWMGRTLGVVGCEVGEFLTHGGMLAHSYFETLVLFCTSWFAKIVYLIVDGYGTAEYIIFGIRSRITKILDTLWERTDRLIDTWWDRIQWILDTIWTPIEALFGPWWARVEAIFGPWWVRVSAIVDDWWILIDDWFTNWCRFFVDLFNTHKTKIIYCLTDGWPKVLWFIMDRFDLIFDALERHTEGWKLFVEDPAQALWEWVEPELQELTAKFLVRLW